MKVFHSIIIIMFTIKASALVQFKLLKAQQESYNEAEKALKSTRDYLSSVKVEAEIGSPPQKVTLLGDTSYSTVFVPGNPLISQTNAFYNDVLSMKATHINDTQEVTVRYGVGEGKGIFLKDTLSLGDAFSVENLRMIKIETSTLSFYNNGKYDGVLGLSIGLDSLPDDQVLINQLYMNGAHSGPLKANQFSLFISAFDKDYPTQLLFGGFNKTLASTPFTYYTLIQQYQGFWQISLNDVLIDGVSKKICNSQFCKGIFSSGTTIIGGNNRMVASLLAEIKLNADCTNVHHLPYLQFVINSEAYIFEPNDYVIQNVNEDPVTKVKEYHCAVNIVEVTDSPDDQTIILGEPFLKKYYTIFDRQKMQIGLAKANHLHDTPELEVPPSKSEENQK